MSELYEIQMDYLVKLITTDHYPEYYNLPSSRTGKWHPPDEFKFGGLGLHTKRVVTVLDYLIEMDGNVSHKDACLLRTAALIHDLNKAIDPRDESCGIKAINRIIEEEMEERPEWADKLIEIVAIHGGRFYDPITIGDVTYVYNSQNKLHRLMHTADYIASRNDIRFDEKATFPNKQKFIKFKKWLINLRLGEKLFG